MTRLYLVKTEGGDLIGYNHNDSAYIARMKPGECIQSDTRKARNPEHHEKFFALFDLAFATQTKYPHTAAGKKALMVALKLEAGWYEEHVTLDGRLVLVPLSLSWGTMGQEEFDKFYRDAMIALGKISGAEEVILEADEIIARAS
jgi:hypothetical protein